MLLLLVPGAVEPPPAGYLATGEAVLKTADAHQVTFFAILASVGPVIAVGGLIFLVVKYVLPAYREEKKSDREHLSQLVKQRGDEAAADLEAGRELARAQVGAIVTQVEAKVDRVSGELTRISDRVDRHGETLTRIAAKLLPVLLLIAASLMLAGCSTLPAHIRMAWLTAGSLKTCKEDGGRCPAAKLCRAAAVAAGNALQEARRALAEGIEDEQAELRAATLPVAADAQCAALKIKPAAPREVP